MRLICRPSQPLIRSFRSCNQICSKTCGIYARSSSQHRQFDSLRHSYSTTTVAASEKRPEERLTQFVDDRKASGASFQINGNSITVIDQPANFYKALKAGIFAAKSRIVLSSLYVGKEEKDLIATLQQVLLRNRSLRVSVLIDAIRGTRESPSDSSASLLATLVKEFPNQVDVNLFHTPKLTGLLKRLVPKRFNESVGLMHMKVYAFDDDLILSGANLSSDYFSNRQDRYFMFKSCRRLTEYFTDLVDTVKRFSFQLRPVDNDPNFGNFALVWPTSKQEPQIPNPLKHPRTFTRVAKDLMTTFQRDWQELSRYDLDVDGERDTVVVPILQMGPFDVCEEETSIIGLLDAIHRDPQSPELNTTVDLTSGYFSLYRKYQDKLLQTIAIFRLLAASPQANGFYGSAGVSKYIPDAYTFLEKKFYDKIVAQKREGEIRIEEWRRMHWTYHAKGIWVTLPTEEHPRLTMIGSSNYGHRSARRDLEAQVLIYTDNLKLAKSFSQEVGNFRQWAYSVDAETFSDPERQVKPLVKLATMAVKSML